VTGTAVNDSVCTALAPNAGAASTPLVTATPAVRESLARWPGRISGR
jgi:hypothetical protein